MAVGQFIVMGFVCRVVASAFSILWHFCVTMFYLSSMEFKDFSFEIQVRILEAVFWDIAITRPTQNQYKTKQIRS